MWECTQIAWNDFTEVAKETDDYWLWTQANPAFYIIWIITWAHLELIWGRYTDFGDTQFRRPNLSKVEKEKTNVLHKNKKL